MASYEEILKAQKKITDATLAAEKASFNSDVDKATAIATQNAEKAEETTKQGYEDVFRKNRLNQIINEEKTKERMINLGLTDSGLNRTQQTAIQLQAANADAAAVRNRQAAVDEIRRGIAEFTAQQEAKKNDYSRERTAYWDAQANSQATSIYNAELEAAARKAEAEAAARKAEAEAKSTSLNQLYTHLSSNNDDAEYSAKLITEYAYKYDIDENSSEFDALLRAAKLERAQYDNYIKTGKIYAEPKEYRENNSYIVKNWDYKTAGKQKYKIKIAKATNNYTPLGVDLDDEVTIYYPDGTLLAENIPLKAFKNKTEGNLLNNALTLTSFTARKNAGDTGEVELDLSQENINKYIK